MRGSAIHSFAVLGVSLSLALSAPPRAAYAGPGPPNVIYVDDSAVAGMNDGTSWPDAFTDLQCALALAQGGDEIRIAQGNYKPAPPNGPRDASFNLHDGAHLRGGYAGVAAVDPDANNPTRFLTVLSGDLNGNDAPAPDFTNHVENAYHVITAHSIKPFGRLFGLTIRGGYAMEIDPPHDRGGGITTTNGTLILEAVILERNYVRHYGGGISADQLLMSNCTVRENAQLGLSASAAGGGVIAGAGSMFFDTLFIDNGTGEAVSSGALSTGSAIIVRCNFVSNNSGEDAGAVSVSDTDLIDCRFVGNTASYRGGAVLSFGSNRFINCVFLQNGFVLEGGAVAQRPSPAESLFLNCGFAGNLSFDFGGSAIINDGRVRLVNCTIIGNEASAAFSTGGAVQTRDDGTTHIHNSILWANSDKDDVNQTSQVFAAPAAMTISHSIVQGWTGSLAGVGNHGNDPRFIDADGADNIYGTADDNPRLLPNSPCIDSGDLAFLPPDAHDLDGDGDTSEPLPIDLDGLPRVVGASVDMGAFEFQGTPCRADIDGSTTVDVNDLLLIIGAWGTCPIALPCNADLNLDGTVGVPDLIAVLRQWGPCG